jgi:hypothetical protein
MLSSKATSTLLVASLALASLPLRAHESGAPVVDLSGIWQWRQTTQMTLRSFVAQMFFGIDPEGPTTHVRCESTGTLTLAMQTDSTFTGSTTQSSVCRTQDGVVFAAFPPTLQVENGRILGHSFSFDFTSGGFPCPQTGSIEVRDGQAVELRGTGDCSLPIEPPLAGSYKDIQLVATR